MNLFYETEDNSLMHYGVPGMKWGRRKAVPTSGPGVKRYGSQLSSNIQAAKAAKRARNNKIIDRADRQTEALYSKYGSSKKFRSADGKNVDRMNSELKSSKAQYKKDVANAKKSAVKSYEKEFNKADKAQESADKKWNEVQAKYKSLGKTKLTRTLNAARNKSDLAKEYNKKYNDWEKAQNAADKAWKDAKAAYTQTGRNRVEMIFNNIKYGK